MGTYLDKIRRETLAERIINTLCLNNIYQNDSMLANECKKGLAKLPLSRLEQIKDLMAGRNG